MILLCLQVAEENIALSLSLTSQKQKLQISLTNALQSRAKKIWVGSANYEKRDSKSCIVKAFV